MQRLRHRYPTPVTGLLLAAGLALGATQLRAQSVQTTQPMQSMQMAQTALVYPDPFAPQLETNPRKPPRFKKSSATDSMSLQPPPAFTLPASGAGLTGFDASNAAKKPKTKPKPGSAAKAQAGAADTADASTPAPVSPYQVPPPPLPGDTYAAAPGAPPVAPIGPIAKPIKKRKAHTEPPDPYAPLGIRAGAFDLYPSIELLGGYDSNPGQTANGKGAALYSVTPELKVQSDWSRHELKADLRGSYTGYDPDQTPSLSRPYFDGKVDGRIDVTSQTHILLDTHTLVSTDNPGSPNLQAGLAKLPLYTDVSGDAGIDQRFNRFDIILKGGAERIVYQDSQLTDGTTASNEDRNYNQYGGSLRGGYELTPGMMPFAEIDADSRVHDLNVDYSGYQRDSKGITGKLGSTFELTKLLTGEIALGYTERDYQDPRLAKLSGFVGNASLIWTASALDTVKLSGSSTVGESNVAGVSGILYRNVGVQVDHAFRQWLIGTAKVGFGLDDYVGSSRVDDVYSAGIGFTYKFNRMVQLKGEFDQNWLHSNVSGNSYNESIFLFGIRLQK